MIVVSDASPLNYLIAIEEIGILAVLYERVLIPEMVFRELQHPRTPLPVREWIAQAPAWLEVHSVQGLLKDWEKLLVDIVENARQNCSGSGGFKANLIFSLVIKFKCRRYSKNL